MSTWKPITEVTLFMHITMSTVKTPLKGSQPETVDLRIVAIKHQVHWLLVTENERWNSESLKEQYMGALTVYALLF
jgi:hypothetical protein